MDPYNRDLNYYKSVDKVYWVPVSDISLSNGRVIKQNTPTPCVYVHDDNGVYRILQFDLLIEFDNWRYTAWRKVLGQTYNIRVDVLLIDGNELFTLEGKEVLFEDLQRSDIWIDKEYLAKCDIKS